MTAREWFEYIRYRVGHIKKLEEDLELMQAQTEPQIELVLPSESPQQMQARLELERELKERKKKQEQEELRKKAEAEELQRSRNVLINDKVLGVWRLVRSQGMAQQRQVPQGHLPLQPEIR